MVNEAAPLRAPRGRIEAWFLVSTHLEFSKQGAYELNVRKKRMYVISSQLLSHSIKRVRTHCRISFVWGNLFLQILDIYYSETKLCTDINLQNKIINMHI